MAERVIWLMIRVRWSISRPGARAFVTGAPAHAVLRHVDWVRGHDGDEVLDEYKKIRSTKVDPGCCCARGRPTTTRTRSPSGSSALWAWLDPETVASRIIDHVD